MSQPKTYSPTMKVKNISHLLQMLRFEDMQNTGSQELPPGQCIVLERFVGKENVSEPNLNFGLAEVVGSVQYEINFTQADVGKTIYYRCCYISTQGKKSPWSKTLTVVIV
jgi:hypothetical protein